VEAGERQTPEWYAEHGVELRLGCAVTEGGFAGKETDYGERGDDFVRNVGHRDGMWGD
jgi:hypothetical protein